MAAGADSGDDDAFVVVPERPGALLRPGTRTRARRERDDLDAVIDELLPAVTEGPSAADVVLLVAGLGLLGWGLVADGPWWTGVVGVLLVVLGAVLPLRAAVLAARGRRRQGAQQALTARGTVLHLGSPVVRRLVAAHDDLVAAAPAAPTDLAGASLGAAHAAALEVAGLLDGRSPAGPTELAYVEARTVAVEGLAAAVRRRSTGEIDGVGGIGEGDPDLEAPVVDPELRVRALQELDELGSPNALTRIADVRADPRLAPPPPEEPRGRP